MNIPNSSVRFAPSFEALCRTYDLHSDYDFFLLHNFSARAPYHNEQHMRWVVEDTFRFRQTGDYANTRTILLAALFHDYRHSAGVSPDLVNIDVACSLLKPTEEPTHSVVEHAIRCTHFDGKCFPIEPCGPYEEALRDADISTIFHVYEPVGRAQFEGLLVELNVSRHAAGIAVLTPEEFVERNEAFLNNAKFYTPFAQALKANYLEQCVFTLSHYFLGGNTPKERELRYQESLA